MNHTSHRPAFGAGKNNDSINSCYRLLALCARAESHPLMLEQLSRQLEVFTNWDELPAQAELHGMAPLLWHHIRTAGISIPPKTEQTLKGLYLRHRALNQAHTHVLLDVTSLFEAAGIRTLVLKGLGLAYKYYPDPALRPTSDIDLLLKRDDVLPALDLLAGAGFRVSTLPTTRNLLPKELTADAPPKDGIHTRIELHHYDPAVRSIVDNSLDDEFSGFDAPPHPLTIGGNVVYVPDPMNTLDYLVRHLTRHMFVATSAHPLPLRWLADIINIVEYHAESIDWTRNRALLNRIEVLYSLTPLPERYTKMIPIRQIQSPAGVNRYPQGWPQQVFPEWKRDGFWNYIKRALASPAYIWHTLTPPSAWWLRLQYGIDQGCVFWYGQVVYRLQVLKMMVAKFTRRE